MVDNTVVRWVWSRKTQYNIRIMGFIKLSAFRPQEQLDKDEHPGLRIERLPSEQGRVMETKYPFLPRITEDADLPYIPATEVAEYNGDGPNRLCTYLSDRCRHSHGLCFFGMLSFLRTD